MKYNIEISETNKEVHKETLKTHRPQACLLWHGDDGNELEDVQEEGPSEEGGDPLAEKAGTGSEEDQIEGTTNSRDKKRSVDARNGRSAELLVQWSNKKLRQEESSNSESCFQSPFRVLPDKPSVSKIVVGDGSASEEHERKSSSGKRRRGGWDTWPEGDEQTLEVDQTRKRQKTRWVDDSSALKMLGPIQLPNIVQAFEVEHHVDPKVEKLKKKLLEINRKLLGSLHDDRPEEERSPSPEPVFNDLGVRVNTRKERLRNKLIQERQGIILELIKKNPTFQNPPDNQPPMLFKKLYIPVKEYPNYNFVGLIIGPHGNTQKRMQNETGAKILLRGKGSTKKPSKVDEDDLHVLIEADNQTSLDDAVAMVKKLLIPVDTELNDHKRAQLREIAKLNGSYRDESACTVCSEQGHWYYACPHLQSTFETSLFHDPCRSHDTGTTKPAIDASNSPGNVGQPPLDSAPTTKCTLIKEASNANLYVGYLPHFVDDKRLKQLFSPFGWIVESKVIIDRAKGFSKGYGFVRYANSVDAASAVSCMNGYQMDGKRLVVRVAGKPPVLKSPAFNHLPKFPGTAPGFQNVQSQIVWRGPPGPVLLESPGSFPGNELHHTNSCFSSICAPGVTVLCIAAE
ncbi:RNA recognition motif domain [Dillenia turbinata]|uniref:Branchpoint-bridging protein n=1 Tax=Dillenia turbinata TaxID=194707 RepID=A0AAN8ZJG2_9MAGN